MEAEVVGGAMLEVEVVDRWYCTIDGWFFRPMLVPRTVPSA
jgi:hypothetical protein